jgi:hypothetical protein
VALLKLQRAIHAKLVLDSRGKWEAVEREYENWQRQPRGDDARLYSATKQQASRFRQRIRKRNGYGVKPKEYPLILRRDCVKIQRHKDSVFRWWIRIPINPRSIWVPIQFPRIQEPLLEYEVRECKLIRDSKHWFVNITVQKNARLKRKYARVPPRRMEHSQTGSWTAKP